MTDNQIEQPTDTLRAIFRNASENAAQLEADINSFPKDSLLSDAQLDLKQDRREKLAEYIAKAKLSHTILNLICKFEQADEP
jgi:hypothetical protein